MILENTNNSLKKTFYIFYTRRMLDMKYHIGYAQDQMI